MAGNFPNLSLGFKKAHEEDSERQLRSQGVELVKTGQGNVYLISESIWKVAMLSWDSVLRNAYRVLSLVAQDVRLELSFASVKNVSSDMRVRVCSPSTWE